MVIVLLLTNRDEIKTQICEIPAFKCAMIAYSSFDDLSLLNATVVDVFSFYIIFHCSECKIWIIFTLIHAP